MLKSKLFIYSILTFIIFSIQIKAEGWTKKSGKGFFSLEYRVLSGNKYHDNNGENIVIPKLTDATVNFYSEYGATSNLTFLLNFPFYKILSSDNLELSENKRKNSGIGDVDIGIRYKLWVINQTTISASLLLGVPLAKDTYSDDDFILPLGDDEFNQLIGFEVGHSLYPIPAYLSGSIKYNIRSKGYSHQAYYVVEGGYRVMNNLLLNLRLHALQSLHNGDKSFLRNSFLFANNQQFIAYKLGAFYNISKNLGVAGSFESGVIAYNIQSAPVFSLGFFFQN